ncbi:type II toxin-antitoxin system VapB family antitoxin [Streptomyces sp. TBY4]|uniref:type II toxin-antitoxin system VapB family antitoxin n=1 Tax=Streptomyces sp. TBY4 TaxID=2962030 RepID=UPI0020B66E62|nr:type II toxin-antitoxin system VapB family antitoxin [Streptomyces sp. TBY4]MCP3759588.1 type II toxin-antitoxin system VapB family antitoxin [Streptomyces sp. TBY4]
MARTVIDVDDALLAEAAEIFGTKTKVATVNAALQDVVNRRKREAFFTRLAEGLLPDLTGPVDQPEAAAAPAGPAESVVPDVQDVRDAPDVQDRAA